MAVEIPEEFIDLLQRPIVAALSTLMPSMQPQTTPVWFSFDGQKIWINTARNRQKDYNMMERPRVSILIIDPNNPYRYMEVRGDVVEETEEGAVDHINQLSAAYRNQPDYYATNPQRRQTETRVIYKILPTHIVARNA
jgi:PPOX class probable F420-dependent enzyme